MVVGFYLCLALLGASFFAGSLEMLSGTVMLPRVWWLYNDPRPLCIFCEDLNQFLVTPASFEVWEQQSSAKWRECIKQKPKNACDQVVLTQYYRIGRSLKSTNVYIQALTRFRRIVDAQNGKALWGFIIAAMVHGLSACFTVIFLLVGWFFYGLIYRDPKEKPTNTAEV